MQQGGGSRISYRQPLIAAVGRVPASVGIIQINKPGSIVEVVKHVKKRHDSRHPRDILPWME